MDLTRILDRTRQQEQAPSEPPAAAGGCCAFELAEDDGPDHADA